MSSWRRFISTSPDTNTLRSRRLTNFHPNINTVTLTLAFADFLRFLESCGNTVLYVTV